MNGPLELPRRTVGEWTLEAERTYGNPFADVRVDVTFRAPSGRELRMPAYYDGDRTWRVRFNPDEAGEWSARSVAAPAEPSLVQEARFTVTPREARGFVRATPGEGWGWMYESGEPIFFLGDTTYNLFGMAYCGGDVAGFMRRRAAQGFNILRVRVPVSPFHPPRGYNDWQTRRTWPWGGSEQAPQLDRFNLDYFEYVDAVFHMAEELGLGFEVIMEGWGLEFPFRQRDLFLPEWEQLWMRYLIARYDAFTCTNIWTLMNEYEYYPDGDWRYKRVADLWAMRMGRWVKETAPHGHVVAVHNGPRLPPFAQRFAMDYGAIDAIMFQDWGSRDAEWGWLADGIEDTITSSLDGWPGSAVFAEWGYERNNALELKVPTHLYCDEEHTRRGAWRGAFCALGIIHGFENSWGPWMILDEDQAGLQHLLVVRRFFTEVMPFADLRPAPDLVVAGPYEKGCRPLALATEDAARVAVYLPVGGKVALELPAGRERRAEWFSPVTGTLQPAEGSGGVFRAPEALRNDRPQDWVLVLR